MNITFIGLGIMGSRMATHLIDSDINLTVYNRTAEAAKLHVNQGATAADTPQSAVVDADVVFSMLSAPDVVEEMFFGEGGTLSKMKKNTIWVDCTTVNPSFSISCAAEAEKYDVRFTDAPVSGSKHQAHNAELSFFCGGASEVVAEIEIPLNMMGQRTIHIGDVGQGSSFKMLANSMLAQSMLMFSETILLGEKMGISKDFLLDTLPNLHVAPPFTKVKAATIKENNYDVQFPLEWMHKDLHLACLTAYEKGQPLFLANLTKEVYAKAKANGFARLDFSAIHKYMEESSK